MLLAQVWYSYCCRFRWYNVNTSIILKYSYILHKIVHMWGNIKLTFFLAFQSQFLNGLKIKLLKKFVKTKIS